MVEPKGQGEKVLLLLLDRRRPALLGLEQARAQRGGGGCGIRASPSLVSIYTRASKGSHISPAVWCPGRSWSLDVRRPVGARSRLDVDVSRFFPFPFQTSTFSHNKAPTDTSHVPPPPAPPRT